MCKRRLRRLASSISVTVASIVLTACELEEITLVDVEDVVIAEVYVNLMPDPTGNEIRAFLHRTVGLADPDVSDLLGAVLTVRRTDGLTFVLPNDATERCLESSPVEEPGACFLSNQPETALLGPGDVLEVQIDLVGGGRLTGATRIPGGFTLDGVPETCRIDPDMLMTVEWSRSDGAWAYLNETSIEGLPEALLPEGIRVEEESLYLLGISVSDDDTEIVFPSEFGVFNRLDLDQELAVRLQRGLPEGAFAEVTITAVDQNYVNWARGGSFNPSGQVRVPSLRGEGSGVFGSTFGHGFNVVASGDSGIALPICPRQVAPPPS